MFPPCPTPPLPLTQALKEVSSALVKGKGFPICGNQMPPVLLLGPSCLLLGAWVTACPPCPRRDSSLSLGGGQHTPQLACTRYPTCLSHTAYTGHAGCRGSGAEGGTGTGDSWPAEKGQAKGTARPSGHKQTVEEYGSKGHTHGLTMWGQHSGLGLHWLPKRDHEILGQFRTQIPNWHQ